MLAAGVAAQTSFSTLTIGLPAMVPALREQYGLGLQGVGLFLAAEWVGLTLALLPWGFVSDRIGERRALAAGLAACGVVLACVPLAGDSAVAAGALVALAGAAGASVQSASGRAVMQWFAPRERGFAFGVRQTAVPLGGIIGALSLPPLAAAFGTDAAFVFLGALCLLSAAVGWAVLRDLPGEGRTAVEVEWTLRDRRLWVLCGGSGLFVAAQIVLFGFLVLYLHDERGYSTGGAALALAVAQGLTVVLRLSAGRWSDVLGSRLVPLRRIGLATTAVLAAATAALGAPNGVVVPLLVAATALAASWNGLSFAAAAELAGLRRSGAAIGFQQTVLSVAGVVVPPAFALVVVAGSWRLGFALAAAAPLAGWVLLGTLREPPTA